MDNQIILAIKQLTKKYGDVTAVEKINLNVKKGRIYGLLGRNGADEPTNGLDPVGIVEIRKFLQSLCHEQGKTIIISNHILSEISLLADDIGIIHDRHLLKEISMNELEEKNKKYIEIKVNNVAMAAQLLENVMKCKNYSVTDKSCIDIYDEDLDTEEIANCMVSHGAGLSSLYFNFKVNLN